MMPSANMVPSSTYVRGTHMHLISATSVLTYLKPSSAASNYPKQKLRQHDNFGAAGGELEDQFRVIRRHSYASAALKGAELLLCLQHFAIFCGYGMKPDIAAGWPERKPCHIDEPNTFEIQTVRTND